jgi:hypothetical protein
MKDPAHAEMKVERSIRVEKFSRGSIKVAAEDLIRLQTGGNFK